MAPGRGWKKAGEGLALSGLRLVTVAGYGLALTHCTVACELVVR